MLLNEVGGAHVLALTETWLGEEHLAPALPGYGVFHCPRPRHGEGTGRYERDER